jgi:hypothetical protein
VAKAGLPWFDYYDEEAEEPLSENEPVTDEDGQTAAESEEG